MSPFVASIVEAEIFSVSPAPGGIPSPFARMTRPPPPAGGFNRGVVIATAALMLFRLSGSVTPSPAEGSTPFTRIFLVGSLWRILIDSLESA